ncbi:MAG: TIGR03013 family PEP-CTERM/XrtA system glycosyltransferase, partial [Desulfobacterales bacterium]|nr:TIGR03013 family PEP-CTERM/XrtA system glycosyltransferase [Desulfobacterales bacterium]
NNMLKIFHTYFPIRNILFILGEGVLIYLSLIIAALLRFHWKVPEAEFTHTIWAKVLVVTLICQISLYYHELYEIKYAQKIFDLSVRIIQALGAACIILAGIYYVYPSLILGRGIFLIGLFLLILFIVSWRFLYQCIIQKNLFSEKLLLLGSGNLASLIAREIAGNLDSGYKIAAIVNNPNPSDLAKQLEMESLNDYQQICAVAKVNGIQKIVVALDEKRGKFPTAVLLDCKMKGLTIVDGVSFYETLAGKILAAQINPSSLIFSEGFRRHKFTLWGKRFLDIVLSAVGLVISAPLMLLAAIAIKTTSKGPVFFKQTRVGQWEKPFSVIKFRTMQENAETHTGPIWAEEGDPRITPVGKLLRRCRMDELPQLWNVLKGSMSLVGPRPERPVFVKKLKDKLPYYAERHTVKPGITGWAQISYGYGASEEDALKKLEYDLFYIKHLSLLMDFFIIVKTLKIVILGKGAR